MSLYHLLSINSIKSRVKNCCRLITAATLALIPCIHANALPADYFASSSRLAEGNWAKIEVKETGMQFISNATLRNLGFSNPYKVSVFGFGGRMLPESLDSSMKDDLPEVISLHTTAGILFFGHSTEKWTPTSSGSLPYTHTSNPYSDNSYYFLSDSFSSDRQPTKADFPSYAAGEQITYFSERILHEKDIIAPSTSGRTLLGEDFRSQSTQTFSFSLPDNLGDASILVRFGAKVTNGQSSLIMTANGIQLPASVQDKISGVSSSETFLNATSSAKTISNPGEKLNLSIQYSHSGALFTAALDYIELAYPRQLRMRNGELYFYFNRIDPGSVVLEGVSAATVIWDVTEPESPAQVEFTTEGSKAIFAVPAGYREYIAFNPSEIKRTVIPVGKVSNQNLHGMESPDMVIIAPELFLGAAKRLADLHRAEDGMNVAVLTPQQVYNEFSSGVPDVTAFRKLLKMWYSRGRETGSGYPLYCLLFSRPTYDNKIATATVKRSNYPRIPIWQSPTGMSATTSFSTDDYIGMLDDNLNSLDMNTATIHVAVGRFPVKTVSEANIAVAKLENYIKNPVIGDWRNNVMVIADDQDNGEHLSQAENVIELMRGSGNGSDFIYEKLYLDSYPLTMSATGASYPLAKQRMMDKFNEGVLLVDYIGHANAREWGHEALLTWTDVTAMTNQNLPFIYAATCEFLEWDADEVSAAEMMWLNPDAGVIGMVCPSRKVYITLNGNLNKNTAPYFFERDASGRTLPLGEIVRRGKNATTKGDNGNRLRYGFMGDPAMRLPAPSLNVTIDEIGNVKLNQQGTEPPVLKARGKVKAKGRITDNTGNIVSDFNGQAHLRLFDAEKVIDTYGNGEEGKVVSYNDRKNRLYMGVADVKNGEWETEIFLPSEIENNYSPALLSIYAADDRRREANGSTESLYVYGYDESAADDNLGPEITSIYINDSSFENGQAVSPSSVLIASFSDPSGINVSDFGIGHEMTITIDGKIRKNDVTHFYTPSADATSGSISYPLQGIDPGKHTLDLTVWDNANNSTTASIDFVVKAGWLPSISELSTDANPAVSSVTFTIATDGSSGNMKCRIEVFDLTGRKVWWDNESSISDLSNTTRISWNLCDQGGRRVPRGIYLYRATVVTAEGAEISKSGKLAVASQ